ncbi:MAG: chromosomal replication initiator protein DnaA [Coriobacteriia bacterium]|nr:chromosomal replication initiator protein DnaA [Coriobacteriia bacterium]
MDDINKIWNDVTSRVKELDFKNENKVDAFLPMLRPQVISDNYLMLTTNNSFIKFWVETHILSLVKQALFDLYNQKFEVQIEIDQTQDNSSYPELNMQEPKNIEPQEPILKETPKVEFGVDLSSILSFENFVIGDSNNIAYQMSLAVAETPGKPNLNPLFLYGKSGIGKTHLLYAIKNYIEQHNPNMNVMYIDATEFINEYTNAATSHDIDKSSYQNFNDKYINSHVLLIDDLQLLQGKKGTLNTFFSIFNKLTSIGRQIVISADRAPKNIDVEERYQSRFNNGMSCEITAPEVEVKLGIIDSYIEDFKKDDPNVENYITQEIKEYIAQNSSSNIRELKSAITKVLMQSKNLNHTFSTADVKQLLEEHFSKSIKKRITIEKIQSAVEKFYNINHSSLIGKKKDKNIAYARQIAMYLCYNLLETTVSNIGNNFNRDHSTVIHSIKVVEDKRKNNRSVNEELEVLEKMIREN